jgi:hypothetical protein
MNDSRCPSALALDLKVPAGNGLKLHNTGALSPADRVNGQRKQARPVPLEVVRREGWWMEQAERKKPRQEFWEALEDKAGLFARNRPAGWRRPQSQQGHAARPDYGRDLKFELKKP